MLTVDVVLDEVDKSSLSSLIVLLGHQISGVAWLHDGRLASSAARAA